MKKKVNHSRSANSNVNDAFGFLVEQCFAMITHDCDCPNCTIQKGRAVKGLMYIFGDKLGIEEAARMLAIQNGEWGFAIGDDLRSNKQDDFEPIPDEVIWVVQEAVTAKNLTEEKRAIIAGWLESVGA